MLTFGVVVLGVTDQQLAEESWCAALGYRVHEGSYGGWARVLFPPSGRTGAVPSWANLVRSGSGLDGLDDPRDMVG